MRDRGYRGALAGAGTHDCAFTAGQHTKSPTLTLIKVSLDPNLTDSFNLHR